MPRFMLVGALALMMTSACLTEAQAQPILYSQPRNERGNGDNLGTYSLPQSVVSVSLFAKTNEDGQSGGFVLHASPVENRPYIALNLSLANNARFKDAITIERTTSGLISKIDINSQDKTADAIISLTNAAASILSYGKAETAISRVAGPRTDLIGTVIFDPTDPASIKAANETLWSALRAFAGSSVGVEFCKNSKSCATALLTGATDPAFITITNFHERIAMTPDALRAVCRESVCVRTNVAVDLRLQAPMGPPVTQSINAVDSGSVALIDIHRASFVTKTGVIIFTDGVPTSVVITKDSEVAAVASIPVQIIDGAIVRIKATMTAIAEVVQLRIDLLGKDKDLRKAQQNLLVAEADLATERKKQMDLAADVNAAKTAKPETAYGAPAAGAAFLACSYDVDCSVDPVKQGGNSGVTPSAANSGDAAPQKPAPKPEPGTEKPADNATPKPGGGTPLTPPAAKPAETKPVETKPVAAKPAAAKPVVAKPPVTAPAPAPAPAPAKPVAVKPAEVKTAAPPSTGKPK